MIIAHRADVKELWQEFDQMEERALFAIGSFLNLLFNVKTHLSISAGCLPTPVCGHVNWCFTHHHNTDTQQYAGRDLSPYYRATLIGG